ncbi:MAG: hypothetical protein Q7S22_00230 [Candidatus Micrarchaeota archaeon]|nr:hypothetical protein [Candidatus Micrarchaeota archaeon]
MFKRVKIRNNTNDTPRRFFGKVLLERASALTFIASAITIGINILTYNDKNPVEIPYPPAYSRDAGSECCDSSDYRIELELRAKDFERLRNEFGISHANRYGSQLLRKILDNAQTSKKVIAVITTRGEGKNPEGNERVAFTIRKPRYLQDMEFRDYDVIPAEAGSKDEAIERLQQISNYGDIGIIILRGHGDITGLVMQEDFGTPNDRETAIAKFDRKFLKRVIEIAPHLEQMGLDSCEGAFPNGLAMSLAKITCVPVIGQTIAGSGEIVLTEREQEPYSISMGVTGAPGLAWQPPEECNRKYPEVVFIEGKTIVVDNKPKRKKKPEAAVERQTANISPTKTVSLTNELKTELTRRIEETLRHHVRYRSMEIIYQAEVRISGRNRPRIESLKLFVINDNGKNVEIPTITDLRIINLKLSPLETYSGYGVVPIIGRYMPPPEFVH